MKDCLQTQNFVVGIGATVKRSEDKIMLYELENDLPPCHQVNYPTCNLITSPCKFCVASSNSKHVSSLIHRPRFVLVKDVKERRERDKVDPLKGVN